MTLSQLSEIWSGWTNSFRKTFDLLSDEEKALAQKRLASCLNCKYATDSRIRRIVDWVTMRKDKVQIGKCGVCNCLILEKTLSFASECPLDTFKGVTYPEKQRWGRVRFEEGKLVTGEEIYITEPN